MVCRFVSLLILLFFVSACGEKEFALDVQEKSFKGYVETNNKVDILWVLDNSSSMQQHQNLLSQQVDYFMRGIIDGGYNYHMGVIHTDLSPGRSPGQLLGSPNILKSSTSNVRNLLQQRFRVGEDGSSMEQGLEAMKRALSPSSLQGMNSGFIRSDASLVVIFLSDENDHSPSQVSEYTNFLSQLKPDFSGGHQGWSAHFIGVLEDSLACSTMNDYSAVGQRYMDLVQASGGVNESICGADFSSALSKIRSRVVSVLTDFPLDHRPDLSTISVWLEGQKVPENAQNGWVYVEEGNYVSFRGSYIPTNGARIKVDYTPRSVFD